MYYLGIDPWVRKLGYALIDDDLKIIDAGILLQDKKSPTREDQFNRANQIFDFFENLLNKYRVEKIAMEKLFFTDYNQSNAEFVYAIRWSLMMLFLKRCFWCLTDICARSQTTNPIISRTERVPPTSSPPPLAAPSVICTNGPPRASMHPQMKLLISWRKYS